MPPKITDEQILKTAMRQSAIDMNCNADDFLLNKNKVVISKENADARRYLKLPFAADLVSYGNNIVASCSPELRATVEEYISSFVWYHCFETPNLHGRRPKRIIRIAFHTRCILHRMFSNTEILE